jgi:hypothetical protein
MDAYSIFENIFETKEVGAETDRLKASWSGEWSRFNEQPTAPNVVFQANSTKLVYVPEGADSMTVSMTWPPLDTTRIIAGTLGFRIDFGNDGSWDYESSITPSLDGTRTETVPISGGEGEYWRFSVVGHGVKLHRFLETKQYEEARIEWEMSVAITVPQGFGTIEIPELSPRAVAANLRFAAPTNDYTMGNISMVKHVYNLNNVSWSPETEPPEVPTAIDFNWWWLLLIIIIILVGGYIVARFWPESRAGKLIHRLALTVGLVWLLGIVKRPIRRVLVMLRLRPRPKATGKKAEDDVVKAELIAEEAPSAES